MGSFTTRDLIWDSGIKHIVGGEPFTARDIVDGVVVGISPQEVTQVLEVLARFGWVEEQTDLDESEWHPCVDVEADELPSVELAGGQSGPETKYDTSSKQESSDDSEGDEEETESTNSAVEREDGVKTLDGIEAPAELIEGEIYVATVDRFTSNAIIEIGNGHINLGPISEEAEGEEVRFEVVNGLWGKCLDEQYTYDGYEPRKDGSSPSPSRSRTWKSSSSSSRVTSARVPNKGGTTGGAIGGKDPDNKNKLLNGLR